MHKKLCLAYEKDFIILIAVLLCNCAPIGPNTYGLWFDPKVDVFWKKAQEKESLKKKRDDKELKQKQSKQKKMLDQLRQKGKNEEKVYAQEQAEREEQQEQNKIERQKRREQFEKQAEEQRELQQAQEEASARQRQHYESCVRYRRDQCKDVTKSVCGPAQTCRIINGSKTCWEENKCSNVTSRVCSGKRPEGCAKQFLHFIILCLWRL